MSAIPPCSDDTPKAFDIIEDEAGRRIVFRPCNYTSTIASDIDHIYCRNCKTMVAEEIPINSHL